MLTPFFLLKRPGTIQD
jgi:phospholipase D1/2